MASTPTGIAQYLTRFGEQTIAGSPYALKKLGVDRMSCSLKIEEYLILCIPFQLGFKRSIFLASLSKQEMVFFQQYTGSIVGLSIALNPENRPEPLKFFLRCTLNTLGQMKGRENVGLFVVDYKTLPDEMIRKLGGFLETQERIKAQYQDYGKTSIRMTADAAKLMGFNMYATIAEAGAAARRIQIINLNSKALDHMEAAGAPVLMPGTAVTYQLFFKKYRINVAGKVTSAGPLPQGLIRTMADLDFSPELVEILDDYWYNTRIALTKNPLF